jgi:cytochrome c-type biogenesis protein CcmH/NrfG
LKKAVALDPGLVDAQFFLGMAFYHEGLYADALAPLEAYRESAGKSLDVSELKQLDGVIAECRARK